MGKGPARHTVEAVIWDWNGTLFDDVALAVDALNALLTRRGKPALDVATYRASFGFPVRDFYVRLGFDFAKEAWTDVAPEFMTAYEKRRDQGRLREDAHTTLAHFHSQGATQVILSAYPQPDLEDVVATFALTPFFDRLVGLDNHYAESKVELGRSMLRTLDTAPADTLYVGNTLHDVEVAQALGTPCVLVAGGHQTDTRLRASGVPIIPNLSALCS